MISTRATLNAMKTRMGVFDRLAEAFWEKILAVARNLYSLLVYGNSPGDLLGLIRQRGEAVGITAKRGRRFFLLEYDGKRWKFKKRLKIRSTRRSDAMISRSFHMSSFSLSGLEYISYIRFDFGRARRIFASAKGANPDEWSVVWSDMVPDNGVGVLTLADDCSNGVVGVITSKKEVYPVYGKDIEHLHYGGAPILGSRGNDPDPNRGEWFFDNDGVEAIGAFRTERGLLVLYKATAIPRGQVDVQIGGALFDTDGGWNEKWRSEVPLSSFAIEPHEIDCLRPLGAMEKENEIRILFDCCGRVCQLAIHHPFADLVEDESGNPVSRYERNPVVSARAEVEWESLATFNPAAVMIDGEVHLLYRALGRNGRSVVGHAVSKDGLEFERSEVPAYVPETPEEGIGIPYERKTPDYRSPASFGVDGSEDPRATLLEDKVHMFYAAFNGYDQARTAGVSISVADFKNKRFGKWSKRVLLTPPPMRWGMGGKNAALAPEKVGDRYAIFHRIWPDICIDYTEHLDLSEFEHPDRWLEPRSRISIRPSYWDSGKVAVGPPPLKIDEGWLLIYTGVSQQTHDGYKIGAMILDGEDPSRVLYRSVRPILSPRKWYEREGLVPNIAYPCGAVIKDGTVFIYYGGADTYACAASAPLTGLVEYVKNNTPADMEVKVAHIAW